MAHLAKGVRFFALTNAKTAEGSIYIYDAIGPYFEGVNAKDVKMALDEVKGAKALNIYINSPGGDVFEAAAIYNLIDRFQAKKTVYIDGLAASAASHVAMVGDRIITAKNALWMIHDPWAMSVGTADEMRGAANMLDTIRSSMIDVYAARTKGKKDAISDWMKAETWMSAVEAKERGFTDEVTDEEKVSEDAKAFALLDRFKNTPQALRTQARKPSTRLAEAEAYAMRIRNVASHEAKQRDGQPERSKVSA